MTNIVPSNAIERIVGVPRHPHQHWGRAVSVEQKVYILHSQECFDSGIDLRECPYSVALDDGIDLDDWTEDVAVPLILDEQDEGEFWLIPALPSERSTADAAALSTGARGGYPPLTNIGESEL